MTKALDKKKLTPEERARYGELKASIASGIKGFITIGQELLEVSDKRLYREEYSSFAEFVDAEYQITASRAYQLCEAAEIVKSLPEKCQPMVDNERQIRALAYVKPTQRAKVLKVAAKAGKVTAKAIQEAARAEEPTPKPPTDDDKFKAAFGGVVPPVPVETTLFQRFESVLQGMIKEIPKDADLQPYIESLEQEAALLRNKQKRTQNNAAYTR